jgi:hypothetical protein
MHKLLLVPGIAGIFTFGEIPGPDLPQSAKDPLVCPAQVDQGLLQNLGMSPLEEGMFLLPIREQVKEFGFGKQFFVFVQEKLVLHRKGFVPDKTAAPGKLLETLFFSIPELESEFIALAYDHGFHYTLGLWKRQAY